MCLLLLLKWKSHILRQKDHFPHYTAWFITSVVLCHFHSQLEKRPFLTYDGIFNHPET